MGQDHIYDVVARWRSVLGLLWLQQARNTIGISINCTTFCT